MGIPTRYWIGVVIFLTMYVNYSVRVNMSINIIAMTFRNGKNVSDCVKREYQKFKKPLPTLSIEEAEAKYGPQYNWDELQQALILGSYFVGYFMTSIPGVLIVEEIGPFHAIFFTHMIAGAANYLCIYGARVHYALLMLLRIIIGLCSGLVYPALQKLILLWAPPVERRRFLSALLGNIVGVALTWSMLGIIIEKCGWEWGFHFISIQIGIFCIIFLIVTTGYDDPENNKWISPEEVKFITNSQEGALVKETIPPYKAMLTSFPFWSLAIAYMGNVWGLNVQILGVPKLLSEVLGFDLFYTGFFAALPQFSRVFFGSLFGVLYELIRHRFSATGIEEVVYVISHLLPGIIMVYSGFIGCRPTFILTLFTLCLSMNGAIANTVIKNTCDLSLKYDYAIFDFINSISCITGVTPLVTAAFISRHNAIEGWGWSFIIAGCVYIITGIVFIVFGTTREQYWE